MGYVPNELLGRVVGMRLLSVEFILDYLVVRFDGDATQPQVVLTCEVFPYVESSSRGLLRDGAPGYIEELRAMLGNEVSGTEEASGVGLRIETGHRTLVVNPTLDELVGPEIALLSGFEDDAWMCWRPGEECFAHLS